MTTIKDPETGEYYVCDPTPGYIAPKGQDVRETKKRSSRKRLPTLEQQDKEERIALAYLCGERVQKIMYDFSVSTRTILAIVDKRKMKRRGGGGVIGMVRQKNELR